MSGEEEAPWWETHDAADYLDELKEVKVEFSPETIQPPPKLTKGIHVRLDPRILLKLRAIASSKGLGATTLARMWILEKLRSVEGGQSQTA